MLPLFSTIKRFHLKLLETVYKRYSKNVSFEDIPEVSSAAIKKTFKMHNIKFEDGFVCFIAPCFLCDKESKLNKGKLYVNKTTGTFSCSLCKYNGQWKNIENHFVNVKKSTKDKDINYKELEKQKLLIDELHKRTVEMKSIGESSFIEILKKFSLPVVQFSVLNHVDLRTDKIFSKLYFPLEGIESETIGYMSLDIESKSELIISSSSNTGILVSKQSKSKDSAVLVPTLADFLVLSNSKIARSIIYLPSGTRQLPQEILPSLEKFNKIVFWFNNDLTSWESARQFSKKLGEKRCLFVRPVDKYPLPHLEPQQDFKAIINAAQPMIHKSITTFNALRQDVLFDLQNVEKVEGIKWKRFPTLNKILKGHRRGELTVITGPTGSGKTTFISEYSLDLAIQGVNTLWGSFEIRNSRLARIMLNQLAEIQLEKHLDQFDDWADKFEKIPVYFMTFHGQQPIKVVMEAVEHASYVYDIAHVIIDNVQFMMGITEEQKHMDRFWKQDVIISAFRTFATRKNCHVSLVIHPRKERDENDLTTSSIFGGAKASQEADNILIIQDQRLISPRGKKFLQVAKNRYTGDLGIMPLEFDKIALSYKQKKKKANSDKVNDGNGVIV